MWKNTWLNSHTCYVCRFEVLMQANVMSSEYDEISDMHKKVLRVSVPLHPPLHQETWGPVSIRSEPDVFLTSVQHVSDLRFSGACGENRSGHQEALPVWRPADGRLDSTGWNAPRGQEVRFCYRSRCVGSGSGSDSESLQRGEDQSAAGRHHCHLPAVQEGQSRKTWDWI